MLTCIIRYHIDPTKKSQFEQYAQNWGQAIPRCGADLVGYYAPCEGSTTLAYGIYNVASLADYERYNIEQLQLMREALAVGYTHYCESMLGYESTLAASIVDDPRDS